MQKEIFIKGARENNLKNIDVTIPRDKLVVLTGLSGSGKSTSWPEPRNSPSLGSAKLSYTITSAVFARRRFSRSAGFTCT